MAVLDVLGKTMLKVFSSSSDRYVKKQQDFIAKVASFEEGLGKLSDSELRAKATDIKKHIEQRQQEIFGGHLREKLQALQRLPEEARKPAKKHLKAQIEASCEGMVEEVFALVRETSDRYLGVRKVFDEGLGFDKGILSDEMQQVYDDVAKRIAEGEDVNKIELPVEFYAQVRAKYKAEDRPPFRFRHFDVQMIGGKVLYEGKIAEMATGEGKTLVATLAAVMVALSGRKVHVITVNDYLAQRDRDWMAPVYEALGLTVGAIQSNMDTAGDERRRQYECDITYGTNNEFGFDYLRDNMKISAEDQVQGPLDYTIIDEVDSILIDEARTPLIISGPAIDDTTRYQKADKIARELIAKQRPYHNLEVQIDQTKRLIANTEGEISDARRAKDKDRIEKAQKKLDQARDKLVELENKLSHTVQYYEVEYDKHSVHLTHEGIGAAQDIAGVGSFYVGANMEWPHLMEQALRAHIVFEREKDYVVQNNEVIIVDEFTGRLMEGRQWSDGLHQAVEAKEGVKIKEESQTLATITIQNFFKLYHELAGMTGTAMTEADEFMKIYQLEVVAIPTNKPIIRDDREDLIYKTMKEKFNAIIDEIYETSRRGQPVLIGTVSIEKNEALSAALTSKYGLEHEVLNAKNHAREAAIVAKAGYQHKRRNGEMWGNVTIATNMAGRGTDIKLGPGVLEAGGLHVIGTERHEARRIDNQLRGRCGRQGDPGSSQFFLCFEDDLMRIFAPDWTVKALGWIGWQEGEPIHHKQISKGVEKAQKKVEQRNFESRKSLLEYDEVMDFQRQVFYTRRQAILEGRGLEGLIWEMIDEAITENCTNMLKHDYPYECVLEWAKTVMGLEIELDRIRNNDVDELEATLRSHGRNNAEQEITITLGEYMSEDEDPREWDLRGLSKWAMSRFGVNISQNKLRKLDVSQVQEELTRAAFERIDKIDFSKLANFLEDDFGRKSLCEWFNQKFDLNVEATALEGKNDEDIRQFLMDRARQAYKQREIEYPVDFILNVAMRREQAGSGFAAKEIADWANSKFHAGLTVENVQEMNFDKLRSKLLDMSREYRDNKLQQEIENAIKAADFDRQGLQELAQWAHERFEANIKPEELSAENAKEKLLQAGKGFLRQELTELEKYVLLQIYDATWKDHLYAMDHLKDSIGLRGFAEKDPKMEYKREGYRMFQDMLSNIREKVTDIIFKAQLEGRETMRNVWNISSTMHSDYEQFSAQQEAAQAPQGEQKVKTIKMDHPKVGRNDPCPCGSGKKYKKCCGRLQ